MYNIILSRPGPAPTDIIMHSSAYLVGMPVAIVGTAMSHGGFLTHGSSGLFNGTHNQPVVRVTDIYDCPIHGPNPMATGSPDWEDQGLPICRVGDKASCTAVVLPVGASINWKDGN